MKSGPLSRQMKDYLHIVNKGTWPGDVVPDWVQALVDSGELTDKGFMQDVTKIAYDCELLSWQDYARQLHDEAERQSDNLQKEQKRAEKLVERISEYRSLLGLHYGKYHELKTESKYFARVLDGTKTFEIRRNDRGFAVGDVLILKEIDEMGEETGRAAAVRVAFITDFAQQEGFVVMSIEPTLPLEIPDPGQQAKKPRDTQPFLQGSFLGEPNKADDWGSLIELELELDAVTTGLSAEGYRLQSQKLHHSLTGTVGRPGGAKGSAQEQEDAPSPEEDQG